MKGDFSRISFDAAKHYSSVFLQQGRVTLDADPNEQAAILLHTLRTMARDIFGPCGGPVDHLGFALTLGATGPGGTQALTIGAGRYYVDGVLVENEADCDYANQPDLVPAADDAVLQRLKATGGDDVWLYLDVWERHISWIEDDDIRESALGGPDTCTRSKVVWQVRGMARTALLDALEARQAAINARLADTSVALTPQQRAALQARLDKLTNDITLLGPNANGAPGFDCDAPLDALDGLSDAMLTARLDPGQQIKDACSIAPDSRYRGVENQLYRVEVHQGSAAGVTPTFKWSRDNGSVATRWLGTDGNDLLVTSSRDFSALSWVELTDDSNDRQGVPGLLVKLAKVDGNRLSVDPTTIPDGQTIALAAGLSNPKVRRWDQSENDDTTLENGAVPLVEMSATQPNWLALEDGIQVQFATGGSYRSGDYWLIPARVATGSIEWPTTVDGQGNVTWLPERPRGVAHHYASLGFVGLVDGAFGVSPCVCTIDPISDCNSQLRANAKPRLAVNRAGQADKPATGPKAATAKSAAAASDKAKP